MVEVFLRLPENVARKIAELSGGRDLAKQSLELLVGSLYRRGELTHYEARTALGIDSRLAMDELLARLGMQPDEYTWDDFLADRAALDSKAD